MSDDLINENDPVETVLNVGESIITDGPSLTKAKIATSIFNEISALLKPPQIDFEKFKNKIWEKALKNDADRMRAPKGYIDTSDSAVDKGLFY